MKSHRRAKYIKLALLVVVAFLFLKLFARSAQSDTETNYKIVEKTPWNESESALSTSPESLRDVLRCADKEQVLDVVENEKYFILKNFASASERFECHNSVTYVTHGDFTFIDNIIPLLKRWNGPVSFALYAPGDDFHSTVESIFYFRHCHESSLLVKKFVTFHIFFESSLLDVTNVTRSFEDILSISKCSDSEYFLKIPKNQTFRAIKNLTYPINVARNLARSAAATHFILVSDVELYPNPSFIDDFIEMLSRDTRIIGDRNVFVLPVFEIVEGEELPHTKSQLVDLFVREKVKWFHKEICPQCHEIPFPHAWFYESSMHIYKSVKREASLSHWEPIFVGSNADPYYDERLSWEGKSDKMTQAYTMCLLDYNFVVLTRGFLIHKPGIKTIKEATRVGMEERNKKIIAETILPEITFLYGENEKCQMYT